jgi:hypothetical protein
VQQRILDEIVDRAHKNEPVVEFVDEFKKMPT